jgi:hypothetical protein
MDDGNHRLSQDLVGNHSEKQNIISVNGGTRRWAYLISQNNIHGIPVPVFNPQ